MKGQGVPWKRFGAEAGIIVFSILVAFAVDRWWDDHQEAKRRMLLLEDLETEIVENRGRLEEVLARQRLRVTRLDELLKPSAPGAVGVGPDSVAVLQQINLEPEIIFGTGSLLWDFSEVLPEERNLLAADGESRTAALKFYSVMRQATPVQIRVGERFLAELDAAHALLAETS